MMQEHTSEEPDDNRRREYRQLFNTDATAQVMESSDRDLVGLSMDTVIVDVSTMGLRIQCDRFLHECSVGIWIDLADHSETFFLTADIRWASWHKGEGYQVGLEFIENPLSDQERWNELWQSRIELA